MKLNLYNEVKAETEVMDASPHRLVQLLFESCIQQIQLCRHYMERKEIAKKCKAIEKAMDIILHLRASLNFNEPKAKKIADTLSEVYQYIEHCLFKANLKNDQAYLDEALAKLTPIKEGWDAIGE